MSSVQPTDNREQEPDSLPAWLQHQARRQASGIALRHKHLGIWQVRSWGQVADEVRSLASALQQRGFAPGASLLVLSRPRPEALLLALAAQWLGGEAALLDPLQPGEPQAALLAELQTQYVFAEGLAELRRLQAVGSTPDVLLYADGRGVVGDSAGAAALSYQALLAEGGSGAVTVLAGMEQTAFALYRQAASGELQWQRISHGELLQHGARLVQREQLGRHEEALAARAFAAGGQARYLLAPWLIAGFRLNFPENLATRDHDRRELGPTLVAGTRDTYARLHAQVLARLPEPGSWRRRLVDWALQPEPGIWPRSVGYWLIRRPLRDVLGFSRTRAPLLVGEPLDEDVQAFFHALAIDVRTWPDPAQWQSPQRRPQVAAWNNVGSALAAQGNGL
ncbi:MAG: AMP-binding protein [Pseudomonas sp.]|uniref:AMP-binding protein n=1 Tax=Pseudomonas sp. TaxID=306 RepID=UPI0030F09279